MEPTGFLLAVRGTRYAAQSALPDAPVHNDLPTRRPSRLARAWRGAASIART